MIKVKSIKSNIQFGKNNSVEIAELNNRFQKVKISVFSSASLGYFLLAFTIIVLMIIGFISLKKYLKK